MTLHNSSRVCNSLAMNNRRFESFSMIIYFSVLTMSARYSAYALLVQKMTLLAGILLLFTACGE